MSDSIAVASKAGDYGTFADLIREYWTWLLSRYSDDPGLIDKVGAHQGLDAELNAIPQLYGPPEGKTFLATRDGLVTGGVAYKNLHDGSCEMKRLFVPARFQGHGTGRKLCEFLVATAAADGYRLLRLDTGYLNSEAMLMYESMGFTFCAPHQEYPPELLPQLRFMEKPLN